jgi:putative membrane protein
MAASGQGHQENFMTRQLLLAAAVLTLFAAPTAIAQGQQAAPPAAVAEGGASPGDEPMATDDSVEPPAAVEAVPAGVPAASQFVREAALVNLLEIESSRLALEKAERAQIKEFAQRMIDDHTKAGDALTAAVQKVGGSLTIPNTLAKSQQKQLDKLRAASGRKFDRQYVRMQTRAHDQAVKLFSAYAESGDEVALRQFCETTLPTLQEHQAMAKSLDQKPGKGAGRKVRLKRLAPR